jgi:single-stranded-DNA-specific exonuclease
VVEIRHVKYRWLFASPQPLLTDRLSSELGVSTLLARCLVNRNLEDVARAGDFLSPRLRQMADPFLLPDMDRAVARLFQARDRRESVMIFGDYDVDGVTSTALLADALGALGWSVRHYLPNRFDEGYGLSLAAAKGCLEQGPASVLLAVDCGSTAVETVQWLAGQGIDALVLDHHQVSEPPPAAVALVNPQRLTAPAVAFRNLCSAGLAFKLVHALVKEGRRRGLDQAEAYDLRPLLDLVALGTIADLVPLTGENRILAAAGLERLQVTRRPGLQALKAVAGMRDEVGVYEVGFQLGPRLNAAGRLETAADALELLRATDMTRAADLAGRLDARNRERQRIERAIAEQVIGAVRARFDPGRDFVIVEGQILWHVGVVGIVASRVVREFHRPAVILGGEGKEWRGSGRSIEGFDLAGALRQCDDLLLRHGGHAMAAGLSLREENLDPLRARLNELARRSLSAEQLQPSLRLDAEVTLADLSLERLAELKRLEPIGQGNPPVQLAARRLRLSSPPQRIGRERQHAKFSVTDGAATAEAVWWSPGDARLPEGSFDLAFAPQIDAYNGRRRVQLRVLDWRPTS